MTPLEEFLAKGGKIEQVTEPPRREMGMQQMWFGRTSIEPRRYVNGEITRSEVHEHILKRHKPKV